MCDRCNGKHSVTSAHVDIAIDNNGTWQDAFQFGEPPDTTWDLNGQNFLMDVQIGYYDTMPKLSLKSVDNEIIIDDVIQRVIHMNVDSTAIQASLTPGDYVYDLIMVDGGNVRTPLMHGSLSVTQGVTGV
jgi:hypothetical protein